ncbi:hypothetical protein ASH01_06670 [Terrabacter sp. Soil811]|uniref:hypothetical protein n=1 Tax=Terrabacter sp. Soil811 TaxID=1736419 RepID=UPI0006F93366|nr:hypothetical protein [Terrabacter sp. Soil811]KRF45505.1 hypothetical protein ASH01_06670 [Terrabacter sp. Soil811]
MPTKPKADPPDPKPDPAPGPAQPGPAEPDPAPAPAPPTSASASGASWRWLFWAAIAIVFAYVVFVLLAFVRADDTLPETDWSRSVYVLLGVEALAFTAVGWLFGREVHRGEAQEAQKHADEAKHVATLEKDRADTAKDAAAQERSRADAAQTKGRILAKAVHSLTEPEVTGGGPGSGPGGGDERSPAGGRTRGIDGPAAGSTQALRNIADELFPSD